MFNTVLIKFQFSSCCMHIASCVWSSHIQCTYSSPSNTYLAIHLLQASTCLLFICFCIILAASYTLSLLYCWHTLCHLHAAFHHIKLSTQLSFRWCNWYCMICSHFNIGGHHFISKYITHPLASSYQWNGPREPIFTCKLLMIPMQALKYLCLLLFAILLQTTGAICKVLCPWVLFHDTTVIDSKFCSFFGPFFASTPALQHNFH